MINQEVNTVSKNPGSNNAEEELRKKKIFKVTIVGAIFNTVLVIIKFLAGIFGHSAAMIADAVHSSSDFLVDIIVLFFVNASSKPRDESHDYGHGKFETLATIIVGMILLFVGFGIFYSGAMEIIDFLFYGKQIKSPEPIALIAAIISIITKEALYHYTVAVGKNVNSSVVIANAWHHRSDAFSSIGTALGIGGAIYLGDNWHLLDPLAAIVVSFFIIYVSFKLFVPAINDLLEKSLPKEIEEEIIKVAKETEGVHDAYNLLTRNIGHNISIEIHISVDPTLNISEAHKIAYNLKNRLREHFGDQTHAAVHLQPDESNIKLQK